MIDRPNLNNINMTTRSKKAPTFKYGIEITKPFSKEMYNHNDAVAKEMRSNIRHAWYNEVIKFNANDEWPTEGKIVDIQKSVQAIGYGSGYSLDMVDKEFRNELETMANWQLHENYSYMCFKGLVPRTTMMMVGFDWEKMDYSAEETDWIPCSKELDMQMANESENIQ